VFGISPVIQFIKDALALEQLKQKKTEDWTPDDFKQYLESERDRIAKKFRIPKSKIGKEG